MSPNAALVEGNNGLLKAQLRSPGGFTAEVYQHGAHCCSWKTPDGTELLFLSAKAVFSPPAAIRGGVPICWPQFSDMGKCSTAHGFARNSVFERATLTTNSVEFSRSDHQLSDAICREYPHSYELSVKTTVGEGTLTQELRVKSTGQDTLPFTAAFHTYFRLQHGISAAAVRGLKGISYLDSLQQRKRCVEEDEEVRFPGEVDRIYVNSPDELLLVDGVGEGFDDGPHQRRVRVTKRGFADVVVWNPGQAKAQRMADFGDDEWESMVAVEVAQAGSGAVEVPPGGEWVGTQVLQVLGA